jgi:hypothetical protein
MPSRSVTWSSHVEVFVIPARQRSPDDCDLRCESTERQCELDDCNPKCIVAAKDRATDDCASRASTITRVSSPTSPARKTLRVAARWSPTT